MFSERQKSIIDALDLNPDAELLVSDLNPDNSTSKYNAFFNKLYDIIIRIKGKKQLEEDKNELNNINQTLQDIDDSDNPLFDDNYLKTKIKEWGMKKALANKKLNGNKEKRDEINDQINYVQNNFETKIKRLYSLNQT